MTTLVVRILGGGERVPLLLDASGVPLFYPTLFATARLRNAGAAVNTIKNKLADIAVLLRWEREQSRDLAGEFSTGTLLTHADVASLRDFTKHDMRHIRGGRGRRRPATAGPGRDLEARVAPVAPFPTITQQQHYNRLSTVADYLEFLASALCQYRNDPQLEARISRMVASMRSHRPRGVRNRLTEDVMPRSPASDVVERFMAAGAEHSLNNPFRTPELRLRNAIIFGLLRFTGMRRGELLSLRVEDFDLGHEPRVWIRRRHDDPHDSRCNQPVAKTKERPLPIPDEVARQVQRYILDVRSKVAPARRHPYLIISHRKTATWGQPLSVTALSSRIFPSMHQVDPDFVSVTPHSLRHHFNYEFSQYVDRFNAQVEAGAHPRRVNARIDEAREADIRKFLNGHRSNASAEVYNKRHVREVSDTAARQLQESITQSVAERRIR